MHINTSTLLNMLGNNVDNNVKQKIQNASIGGKSDIAALVKDKTIGTLLNDTLKGLFDGSKSKNTVFETLQNSRKTFDIKSFSSDIKNLAISLESNPKTAKEALALKEFMVNIKSLDEGILKEGISNSGILLESKLKEIGALLKDPAASKKVELLKAIQSLISNVKLASNDNPGANLINNLKTDMALVSNISQKADIKAEIKTAVSNLLSNIKISSFETPTKTPAAKEANLSILGALKNIEKGLVSNKNTNILSLQKDISLLKTDTALLASKNISEFSGILKNISSNLAKTDLPLEIKTAVNNLLTNISSSKIEAKLENIPKNQLSMAILNDLKTIDRMISTKEVPVLNDIKKAAASLELNIRTFNSNPPLDFSQSIKNTISKITTSLPKSDLPLEVKTAVNNILQNIKIPSFEPKNITPLQHQTLSRSINELAILNETTTKKGTTPLVDQNISKDIKTLINDIKSVLDKGSNHTLVKSIKEDISNIGAKVLKMDIPLDIKKEINNIFSSFKALDLDSSLVSKEKMEQNIPKFTAIVDQLKRVETTLGKLADPFLNVADLLNKLKVNFQNIQEEGIRQGHIDTMKTVMTNLSHNISKGDLPVEVKTAVNNLLSNINNLGVDSKLNFKADQLKQVIADIDILSSRVTSLSQNTPSNLNISQDIKTVLLQLNEAIEKNDPSIPKEMKPTVEKLLGQIEYFQALSYTSSSNYSFLPFSWENIEDGDIKFSKNKDEGYSCQINLNLKDNGEIRILLQLDKKNNIMINMAIEEDEFKKDIQDNLQSLRKGINDIDLTLQALNIFDMVDYEKKRSNPYENQEKLNFGLDLKI